MTKGTWAVFWAFMVAVAFAAVAWFAVCYALVAKDIEKDKIGDLATWVGAIGTVSTLIGTIVLATQERRRAHRERFTNARLIAAGLQLVVIDAESAMRHAARRLDSFASEINGDRVFKEILDRLNSVPLWTAADVVPVQFYDPLLAITLIEFMTKFELAKLGLQKQLENQRFINENERLVCVTNLKGIAAEAVKKITGKAEACQSAGQDIYRDPPTKRPHN